MPHVVRIAGTFAIVLVAYWTYALVAVPLIEPPADPHRAEEISAAERAEAEESAGAAAEQLEGLFPPGAWQLDGAKILQSERVKLLMQDYRNLGGGRVEIHPCSIVLMPDEPPPAGSAADEAQWKRQAVILEAPEGALLEFDQPLNLRRMKIGRLVGGRLIGRITIRSEGKRPGPEDDLWIRAQEVQLTEEEIVTPHPVEFNYGPHYGRGSQMRIKLLPRDKTADPQSLNIAGIESFELRRVERLHLELGELELASQNGPEATPSGPKPAAPGGSPNGSRRDHGRKPTGGRPPGGLGSDLPVEVVCNGPFRFDLIRKVATFEAGEAPDDRVDVLRLHPNGPSDQLSCDLLSIFFTDRANPTSGSPKDGKEGPKKPPAGPRDLQPQRIEARGDPVVVFAPSQKVHARGQRLEYDLRTGRIVLDGTRQVMLQQDPKEIHARSLQYEPAGPGRLGRIVAEGPGWLRGRMDQRPDQQIEARWNDQLRVRPHEENQVISLSGGAQLKFRGIGQLDAPEIHLYLFESPQKGKTDQYQLRPDRMLACQEEYLLVSREDGLVASRKDGTPIGGDGRTDPRQNVLVRSPEFSAAVEQLEIWFARGPSLTGERPKEEGGRGKAEGGRGKAEGGRRKAEGGRRKAEGGSPKAARAEPRAPGGTQTAEGGRPTAATPFSGRRHGDLRPTAATAGRPTSGSAAKDQHFQIAGRLLRASVEMQEDGHTELSELTVVEDVRFMETRTAKPDERPLLVRGDRLHVLDASKPHAAVAVSGRPAHFQGRGLALTGPSINLNRGTNRLWIDSAGRMDLAIDRDLEGRPLRKPGLLQVDWQDSMVFDGRTARFEGAVAATAPHRQLQTETLEVQFKRAVDFSGDKIEQNPEVEQLLCRGGVLMESLSFGPEDQQRQTSHERMQVVDLAVNLDSGALTAGGPGWLTGVQRRSDNPLNAQDGGRIAQGGPLGFLGATGDSGEEEDDPLRGLHVRFQGPITGNVRRGQREMTFHDQVDTAYAPVDSWQAVLDLDDPDALGPGGVLLHCDRLSVNEMPAPQGNRQTLELAADGNTVVEGSSFTARAGRITYAEAKDLLILEGDGRTDARLFRQQQIGGPTSKFAARKILYWPKTNQFRAEGARSLEMDRLPAGNLGQR